MGQNSSSPGLSRARNAALVVAATVLFGAFLAHAWVYRFLTDDAFISFRYARNLATGHGLVFNPGHEPVEGYSNFLWVLILAGARFVGLSPERIANALSLLLSAAVWVLLLRAIHRTFVER